MTRYTSRTYDQNWGIICRASAAGPNPLVGRDWQVVLEIITQANSHMGPPMELGRGKSISAFLSTSTILLKTGGRFLERAGMIRIRPLPLKTQSDY